MRDYPEPNDSTARQMEMEAAAESNAPVQMLRSQRAFDRTVERESEGQ